MGRAGLVVAGAPSKHSRTKILFMPDDLYGGPSAPEPPSTQDTPTGKPDDGDQSEGQTAMLPKSVFPKPPEPGDSCTFRIVRVHDDEVEVSYDEKEKAPEPEGQAPPPRDGTLSSMMQ
jgi:hypothetical protein